MTRRRRPRTAQERVVGVLGTVAPGSLGGRIRNTRPATVVQPNTGGPPSAGFDPNENPVIIGEGATAGGGSTPDDVSTGNPNSISIGPGAVTDDGGASVSGATTVGAFAYTTAADGTAVGSSTQAAGVNSTAVGTSADSHYINSTAVGAFSVADDDHQIMLGTDGEYVMIPGSLVLRAASDGSRWRVTVNSSGVLNVAAF